MALPVIAFDKTISHFMSYVSFTDDVTLTPGFCVRKPEIAPARALSPVRSLQVIFSPVLLTSQQNGETIDYRCVQFCI